MSEQPTGEVLLYQRDGAPALEVRLDADTVWLSQQQIADLFQTSRTNVVEHVRNVYDEGELDESVTCRKFRQVRSEGTRQVSRELPFYNLDLIISVGYRVKAGSPHSSVSGPPSAYVSTSSSASRWTPPS